MPRTVGDGTGTDSVPTADGLSSNEGLKPQNPSSPYDSSRGGKGPEIVDSRTTPLGKGDR